jgi:hypothetical protein
MRELDIIIENGGIEKKIIISSGKISFDNSEESISSKHEISTIVIAGNGDFPPPFHKGSKVLRELRETSGKSIDLWKLVFPLHQNEIDYFKFSLNTPNNETEIKNIENWGIWIYEDSIENKLPNIILINFPFWIISRTFLNKESTKEEFSESLSQIYRTILSGLGAICSYHFSNKRIPKNGALVLSDIGNNLIDKALIANISEEEFLADGLYKMRIRTFTQVLSEWMMKTEFFYKVIISYGEGVRMDLIERAWDKQALESKDDLAEFGEAIELRNKNANIIRQLHKTTIKKSLQNILELSLKTFSNPSLSLSADLIQSRALIEGISMELCLKYNLTIQGGSLFSYIQKIEESKKISPWVTSYLHVIRQLGNEGAHYKSDTIRRPEMPVGKDLIVIHAALNRILSFCIDEQI